jgi:hypothetical protein
MNRSLVSEHVDRASRWIYQGVWAVLVRWFCVPGEPPHLPVVPGDRCESFRPSAGFLEYLKFKFWLALTLLDGLILIGWPTLSLTPASRSIVDCIEHLGTHLKGC